MRPSRALLAWTAVAAVVRLLFLGRGVDTLDRLFIPDDTWYTLSLSRNLAAGLGPTVDGVQLTSGFQPLLAWLQVPLHWLGGDGLAVGGTLAGLALADASVALLLGLLAQQVAGVRAGWAAAALWALSPFGLAHALGGLETSLALGLSLGLVLAWTAASTTRSWAGVGLLCGLCLLARVDTAFLVAGLGLVGLLQGQARQVSVAAVVAALVVAPWWGWCTLHFGSPVPESGSAVLAIVAGHREVWLTDTPVFAWAVGNVIGAPSFDAVGLRSGLQDFPRGVLVLWVLTVGALAVGGRWAARDAGQARGPLLALTAHGVALLGFYSLHVQALWFFRRYLAPTQALTALLLACLWASWGPRLWARALLAVALTFGAMRIGLLALILPAASFDTGHDGVKGYLGSARQAWAQLPPDAVVGALQSGALTWTAPAGARVVNLDGVVDGNSARAYRSHTLSQRSREAGVTHLIDWELNLADIGRRWGEPLEPHRLKKVQERPASDPYSLLILTLAP